MVGVKDTKPVGKHLGKDEDVHESPGMVSFETRIIKLKTGEKIREMAELGWGEVCETDRKLGHQIKKEGWYKEAVNSLISELGLGSSEQRVVSVDACNS